MAQDDEEVGRGLVSYKPIDVGLGELERQLEDVHFDLTVPADEERAREARKMCVTLRSRTETVRKTLKAPVLDMGRRIDDEAKRITDTIIRLETPIATQIKAVDDAREAERQKAIAEIAARLIEIRKRIFTDFTGPAARCVQQGHRLSSKEMTETLAKMAKVDMSFGDLKVEADDAKAAAIASVGECIEIAMAREAAESALAEGRAKLAAETKEFEAKQAEQKKRDLDAEAARMLATEEADRADRERRAAERAEQARIEQAKETLRAEQARQLERVRDAAAAMLAVLIRWKTLDDIEPGDDDGYDELCAARDAAIEQATRGDAATRGATR